MTQEISSAFRNADPAAFVADIAARSTYYETPCGEGVMSWRSWGNGPPLLLLHGAQGSWTHWIRNIEALAEDWTIWAPDLPGFGASAMPDGEDHAAVCLPIAQGVESLIGAAKPIPVVGFSFGGLVAGYLSAQHPALVERIVIVDSGGLGTPHGHFQLQRLKGLTGDARLQVLRHNLLEFMLHDPASVDALTLHLQESNLKAARLNVAALVLPDKLVQILPKVPAPVDAVWGAFDRPHPDPALQEAALRPFCPDLRFRIIPDAGHWAMYEQPEAFNAILTDLLAKTTTGRVNL